MVTIKLKVDKKIYGKPYKSGSIVPGVREEVANRWTRSGKCKIVKESKGDENEQGTKKLSNIQETTADKDNNSDGNIGQVDGD